MNARRVARVLAISGLILFLDSMGVIPHLPSAARGPASVQAAAPTRQPVVTSQLFLPLVARDYDPLSGYIITLTWNAEPPDLDAHLWLPAYTSQAMEGHIYYGNLGNCTAHPFGCVTRDDIDGYGPEVIQIKQTYPSRSGDSYIYAVNNASYTSAPLSRSGAYVQVSRNGTVIADYSLPNTESDWTWWYVFELDGTTGALTPRNALWPDSPGPY